MIREFRKTIIPIVATLALVRFWIEVMTTTIFRGSKIIDSINNNKIGFHHYQIGLLIVVLVFISNKFFKEVKTYRSWLLGIGMGLLIDEYTYLISIIGLKLPYKFRSLPDYFVITIFVITLFAFYFYLGKKHRS